MPLLDDMTHENTNAMSNSFEKSNSLKNCSRFAVVNVLTYQMPPISSDTVFCAFTVYSGKWSYYVLLIKRYDEETFILFYCALSSIVYN